MINRRKKRKVDGATGMAEEDDSTVEAIQMEGHAQHKTWRREVANAEQKEEIF